MDKNRPNQYAALGISELLAGASLALKNAQDLESIATLVADDGKHGQAVALYVLSVEEGLKAYFLFMNAASDGELDKLLPKLFKDHVLKHTGAGIAMLFVYFFGTAKAIYDDGEKKIKQGAPAEATRAAGMQEYFRTIELWATDETGTLPTLLTWYKDANKNKKNGLYVDRINGEWVSPERITKIESDEAKENAREWISCVQTVLKVSLEETRKFVEEIKQNIQAKKSQR